MAQLAGLYAITDERLTPTESMAQQVAAALKGGARIVQLRDKQSPQAALLPIARKLKALCEAYEALFIINDRIDLARAVQADGVHLGREDGALEQAREMLGPEAIVGISCYGDLDRARTMEQAGADYVAFGSFFTSPTKPHAAVVPPSVLTQARQKLSIPLCAIGGITLKNAPPLIEAGADMIAVISDLWQAEDVAAHAQKYQTLFTKDRP